MKKGTVIKKKTLFDHINVITTKSDGSYYKNLSEGDKKTFSVYMIHRFLSMNPDWIDIVNMIQKYSQQLKQDNTFRIYNELIPKSKIWLQYVKSKKEKKYDQYVVNILKKYFELGEEQIQQYYDIYLSSPDGKIELMRIVRMYGGSEKELNKIEKELKIKILGE